MLCFSSNYLTGCMLARLLHLAGIDVVVFESDASPDYRTQGGSLDLHSDTGLAAMQQAELFDEFKKHGRYDGQYLAIVAKNLHYHFVRDAGNAAGMTGECPEIDRAKLREILIESLPDGMVQWGHHLTKVDGKTLIFDHTTVSGFDLIVGADGAWSKVRTAIDDTLIPFYTGVAYYDLVVPDAENTTPEAYKAVNRGSIFASNEGQRVSIQQLMDGGLYIHAAFLRESADWMSQEKCGYDSRHPDEVKRALQKEYSDWCPELRDAITSAQGPCIPRSLHILPVGTKWEHKPGLTLIGDAAHLMAPHAGEGVNQALGDAVLLSRAIISAAKEGKDMDEEIQAFESNMFVRAKKIQQLSYDLCQDWMFTPGAPKSVMARALSRHVNKNLPAILHPIGTAGVYSYIFFRSLVA